MTGAEAGEFIGVGLGLAVLAYITALAIAVPWVGLLVLAGGLAWLVWGWRRDLRQGCR
jgi:hypothetical protein